MFTDTFKLSSEPMTDINKLVMDTYDSVVDAQMASLRGYIELAETQARSVTTIRDIQGIKDFVADQPRQFNQLVNRMSEDLKVYADVAARFRDHASQLFQNTVTNDAEDADTPKTDALPESSQKKASAADS